MKGLAGLAASGLELSLLGCGDPEEHASLAYVFEATFGVKPSSAIQGLQAHGRAFGDNSACYLRFRVSRAQLNGLLGPSFVPITAAQFESNISGAGIAGPTPPLWTPLAGTPTVFLLSSGFHPGFSQSQALVSYDPASQVAHVYWDGLD